MAKSQGPGKKVCEKCGTVCGARTMECKKCGHKFEIKSGGPKKGKNNNTDKDIEIAALRLILKDGKGKKDTILKAIDEFKQDSLSEFISMCGGPDQAKSQLEKITL